MEVCENIYNCNTYKINNLSADYKIITISKYLLIPVKSYSRKHKISANPHAKKQKTLNIIDLNAGWILSCNLGCTNSKTNGLSRIIGWRIPKWQVYEILLEG